MKTAIFIPVRTGSTRLPKKALLKIKGKPVIGENTLIEAIVYIGPYTSVGNHVTIRKGEIENSIIMD